MFCLEQSNQAGKLSRYLQLSAGGCLLCCSGRCGCWIVTAVLCCAGASVASFLFDKGSVSLGASGAVFGLFAVAVLLKLKFSFQKLVRPLYPL